MVEIRRVIKLPKMEFIIALGAVCAGMFSGLNHTKLTRIESKLLLMQASLDAIEEKIVKIK